MKRTLLFLLFAFSLSAAAQVQVNGFSVNASVVSVPGLRQTAVATDVGGTLALTNRLSLRDDSLIIPADSAQAYLGSVQYQLPVEAIIGKASRLPKKEFALYAMAGAGVDRGGNWQHFAGQAGIGMSYDPKANGRYTVNLFELRWARLPGINNNGVLFSSGVGISF